MKADLRTEGQRIGQIKESRELALLKKEKNSKLKNRDSKDEVVKAFREEVKRMRSRRMGFQSVKDGVYRNTRGARTTTRAWPKNKEDKTHPNCEIKLITLPDVPSYLSLAERSIHSAVVTWKLISNVADGGVVQLYREKSQRDGNGSRDFKISFSPYGLTTKNYVCCACSGSYKYGNQ